MIDNGVNMNSCRKCATWRRNKRLKRLSRKTTATSFVRPSPISETRLITWTPRSVTAFCSVHHH